MLCFLLAALPLLSVGCEATKHQGKIRMDTPDNSVAVSDQFGSRRLDFQVGGHKAFLIEPTVKRRDGMKPWIWYAPTFIGHLPCQEHEWMFKQWLAEGFFIGGVDVGESYGSPQGRAIYTEFYTLVTSKYGLSARACLLPQSRGGLMLYNWAVEHPRWVQCIGGIYTVCDLRSYPGLGTACGAYGLTETELLEQLAQHNPVDRVGGLAGEKIPILHIHGDSDTVVPLEKNSGELAARYQRSGGRMTVIVVRGKGHEVCSEFFERQELVDFFKENTSK